MKTQIRNPIRQPARFEAPTNWMCVECGKVFTIFQGALDHAWETENPVGCETYNHCADQHFQKVQWFEGQFCEDSKIYHYRTMGRENHFDDYEPILNADGTVFLKHTDYKKFNEKGSWVWTNGVVREVANKQPKMGLIYFKSLE